MGFSFQLLFPEKGEFNMGNKKDDVKVKGALKIKTMTITNFPKDTEDADVEKLVKGVGSIESFRKAYNLDKMRAKQFTFPVLDDDVKKLLDPKKWPSGVCCRA